MHFWGVFGHFFKFKIFQIFLYCKCRQQGSIWSICKKPHIKRKFFSGDIHPQRSDFGRKRPKWCPKIALYLENRKWYEKSDSIFGIYRKFPFLYVYQIFAYSSSSGWKSGSKIGNFSKFSKILQNFAFFEKKKFFWSKFLNGPIRKNPQ